MVYTKNDFGVDLLINLVIYKTIELHLQDSNHLRRPAYDVVFRHGLYLYRKQPIHRFLRSSQVLTAKQPCPIKQGVELVNRLPVEKIQR